MSIAVYAQNVCLTNIYMHTVECATCLTVDLAPLFDEILFSQILVGLPADWLMSPSTMTFKTDVKLQIGRLGL